MSGRSTELNGRLRRAVEEGHGVVTGEELRDIGFSKQMILRRKESGLLIPVLRDVFSLPGCGPDEIGRRRAAVHAGGEGCCLSHRSALAHHGLVRDRLPVQVVRAGGADRRAGAPVKLSTEFAFSVHSHQTRNLPQEQIWLVEGIRVVAPERALLDFAAAATGAEIGKALAQGERERTLCWDRLGRILERSRGYRGAGLLRREVEAFVPVSVDAESEPEEDLLRMLRRQGLPIPEVNVWLEPYRVDFFWRHLMLILELDPYSTHSGSRSFHRDRRKSIGLELRGFRVIRLTADDLYRHEARTAAELGAIMQAQAELLGVDL